MAGLVFDLDGTLIDSAPDIRRIANTLLLPMGQAPITLDDTHRFIGSGAAVFIQRLRAARAIPDSEQGPMMADFLSRYDAAVTLTQIYPGAVAALETLHAAGHTLAICTNKPAGPTRAVLAHLRMDHLFTAIIAGDSLPQRKPDPAPLHAACAACGMGENATFLFIGDSDVDADTAAAAGIAFVLFSGGYSHRPLADLPHDRLFHDHAALPDVIADLLETMDNPARSLN